MTQRGLALALGACVFALLSAPSRAAAAGPCPGDDIVWVSNGTIYDRSQADEHAPGREDCLQHAIDGGAHFAKHRQGAMKARASIDRRTRPRGPVRHRRLAIASTKTSIGQHMPSGWVTDATPMCC